jgi:hypothetical protein
MKTNHFITLIAVAFGFAAFPTIGCAQQENTAGATSPSTNNRVTATVIATSPAPATTASPDLTPASWSGIEDDTFDMRAHFLAGLKQMQAMADAQASSLMAKRNSMKSTTDTKEWDFEMKEMEEARSYLKSMSEELSKATPETWNQEKDKVSQAWAKTQKAYEKVKSSTTD